MATRAAGEKNRKTKAWNRWHSSLLIGDMDTSETFQPEVVIQAVREGDAEAVAEIVEHYRPYLRLLARMTLGRRLQSKLDDSDVVQEASLMVARDLNQFRGETEKELTAWLRRVLANVIANTRRHYGRERRDVRCEQQLQTALDQSSVGFAQLAGNGSSPSRQAIRREHAVVLARALEGLPKKYNEVLVLRELKGLSLAEIAEQLGGTRNSVQKLWARAIQEMRRTLKDFQ